MFFRKKSKENIKKMDKLITGMIVGGVILSVFGRSRKKEGKPSLLKRIFWKKQSK